MNSSIILNENMLLLSLSKLKDYFDLALKFYLNLLNIENIKIIGAVHLLEIKNIKYLYCLVI